MHMPMSPIATLLPGAHAPRYPAIQQISIDGNSQPDQLLLKKRREVALIEEERTEAALVPAHQSVGQGCSATRMADHKDRRFYLDSPKAGEEDAVEEKTEGVKARYQWNRDTENCQKVETRRGIGLVPRQVHHFSVI